MCRVKQNTATTVLAASLASLLLAGPASAETGPSNSEPGTAVSGERGKLTGANSNAVQIRLTPIGVAGMGSADLIDHGDRTDVAVGLSRVPSNLANPSLIVEIYKATCGDLRSAPIYAVENTLAGYPPAPYYVGGTSSAPRAAAAQCPRPRTSITITVSCASARDCPTGVAR